VYVVLQQQFYALLVTVYIGTIVDETILKCPRCGMEIEMRPITGWDTFKNIFCGNCAKDVSDRIQLEIVERNNDVQNDKE